MFDGDKFTQVSIVDQMMQTYDLQKHPWFKVRNYFNLMLVRYVESWTKQSLTLDKLGTSTPLVILLRQPNVELHVIST